LYAKFGSSFTSGDWTWFINNIPKNGFEFKFELKPRFIVDYIADVL
jgi:hypothetical protein